MHPSSSPAPPHSHHLSRHLLNMVSRCVLVSCVTCTAALSSGFQTNQGSLMASNPEGRTVTMPLRHTEVRAEVSAFVARVSVVQTFENPFDSPIEAIYLFPLPERAAVDDFMIEVGDRRIQGRIHRREEATRIYERARSAGRRAALLHQERPNIFTQSVANIMPGDIVRVHIRYVDKLIYEDGRYRFLFPMVVGPRFFPASAKDSPLQPVSSGDSGAPSGGIFLPPSQPQGIVPDANRINPPVLRPGFRTGHDIDLRVHLDAGVPIHAMASNSHEIEVVQTDPTRAVISLASHDTIPNKDFMLAWDVAADEPEVGILAHRVGDDGFFTLLIQPKAAIDEEEAAPKEIIFVLDESGSMSGLPIEMSKRFMRLALESMGPRDRFNIVRFAGAARVLSPAPLDNTDRNIRRALAAVERMTGSGGTMMLEGFRAALAQPRDPSLLRIVFFLTDGYIGNESQILDVVQDARGDARIFTLGIGSSVNHHLLREMADLGHGAYAYIRPDGNEKEAVERFVRWVTKPYLTDLEIDWGTLRVEDIQPARLPDLYSGQT
ncbi:MAG: VIT domain-containing protein, partial [Acidobacteriota bacterium]